MSKDFKKVQEPDFTCPACGSEDTTCVTRYNLVCIAPNGDHVTDIRNKTYNECVYASQEMGSRWIFFPFHAIVSLGNTTVVDIPYEGMEHFIGKRLSTLKKAIATGEYNYLLEY